MKPLAARLARLHIPTTIHSESAYDESAQLWIAEGGIRAEPVSNTATSYIVIVTGEDGMSRSRKETDSVREGGW
jgi:hypothetical protein